MSNTLRPLEPPFDEEVAALLAGYPQQDGYLLSLFRTFANAPRFLGRAVPNLLDGDSPLTMRTREIVILRVTAKRGCAYEWGVHVAVFAAAAGLSDAAVQATWTGMAETAGWTEREGRLIGAVDQLCATGTLDDPTLQSFQADWSPVEQLEILALCGAYTTISLVANVARLPAEPFAVAPPVAPE